jgi:Flp pilus assembly protein TadB
MRRPRSDTPTLITTAPENADDGYDRRRKKYAIMMGLRAVCVLAAALTYQVSIFLSLAFVVGGIVLPWCAVIIANDRPAKRRVAQPAFHTGYGQERALTAGDDGRTVDG